MGKKGARETVRLEGREIELSHLEKILFPDKKIRKKDIIDYYCRAGENMVPRVRNHLISMKRSPDGLRGESFFQKEVPGYFPHWIKRKKIRREKGGSVTHVVCNDTATLVYLANQACLTPHISLSSVNSLRRPDQLIFDLDPPERSDFKNVCFAAEKIHDLYETIGLKTYVKTTGSKGLHVTVFLDQKMTFDRVRKFARDSAEWLVRHYPDRLTLEQRKDKRNGKVYLDIMRNAYAQTAVAPYAIRLCEGAPIATPLEWKELRGTRLTARRFHLKNIFRRLASRPDPWGKSIRGQSLKGPEKKLQEMIAGEK